MAGKDYLAPSMGAGIQPSVQRGTGPSQWGRVINPPDFSKFGGFVSPSVEGGPRAEPMISIRKPGSFEK